MDSPNVDASVFTFPWVDQLGYERLSDPQKVELIRAARDALEIQVGTQLMRFMSEKDVREFDDFLRSPAGSDSAGAAWLARKAPDYQRVTHQIVAELEAEMRRIVADFDAGAQAIDWPADERGPREDWDGQDGDEFAQPTDQQGMEQ